MNQFSTFLNAPINFAFSVGARNRILLLYYQLRHAAYTGNGSDCYFYYYYITFLCVPQQYKRVWDISNYVLYVIAVQYGCVPIVVYLIRYFMKQFFFFFFNPNTIYVYIYIILFIFSNPLLYRSVNESKFVYVVHFIS